MGLDSFTEEDTDDTTTDDPMDGLGEDELRDRLQTMREIVVSQDASLDELESSVDDLENEVKKLSARVANLQGVVEEVQENGGNEKDEHEGKGSGEPETDNDDSEPLFG